MRRPALRALLESSLGRVREAAWPIAQAAAAAGVAWFFAHTVLGHPQPFFAPIAAVVALAAGIGGRGTQAAQMLAGVAVGVVVGEILVLVLGTGAPQVALAAAAAMLAMSVASTQPLPLIQAGASAILVVVLQSPESGTERMGDALVGGGVALFVSQFLLAPSPVSLLEDAAREALRSLAEGLRGSARALSSGDAAEAEAALESLREGGARTLSDLDAARGTGRKVARRTLHGRRQRGDFARLDACLAETDLLGASVLFLARAVYRLLDERGSAPERLAPAVRELARAVEALSEAPKSPDARRSARASAQEATLRAAPRTDGGADPRVALVAEGVRLAASDLLRAASPEGEGTEPAPEASASA